MLSYDTVSLQGLTIKELIKQADKNNNGKVIFENTTLIDWIWRIHGCY